MEKILETAVTTFNIPIYVRWHDYWVVLCFIVSRLRQVSVKKSAREFALALVSQLRWISDGWIKFTIDIVLECAIYLCCDDGEPVCMYCIHFRYSVMCTLNYICSSWEKLIGKWFFPFKNACFLFGIRSCGDVRGNSSLKEANNLRSCQILHNQNLDIGHCKYE